MVCLYAPPRHTGETGALSNRLKMRWALSLLVVLCVDGFGGVIASGGVQLTVFDRQVTQLSFGTRRSSNSSNNSTTNNTHADCKSGLLVYPNNCYTSECAMITSWCKRDYAEVSSQSCGMVSTRRVCCECKVVDESSFG